jgi:cysteine desulfurase/selenocysteine lyase
MIYFDHAATAGTRPRSVGQAMIHTLEAVAANPGRSGHRRSLEAARIVACARDEVAALIHAPDSSHVAFTKNATEAINVALFGVLNGGDIVLAGRFEHNSVMRPLRHLEEHRGVRVLDMPGDAETPVDLAGLERTLSESAPRVRMIVLASASNVTGQIMPLRQVGALARAAGAFFLVDAAQGAGILDISVERDCIDGLALTGHKSLLGPPGTGALYLRDPGSVAPLLHGGTGSRSEAERQPEFAPDKFEAGTLNVVGLAGLAAGIRHVREVGVHTNRVRHAELLLHLWERLGELPRVTRHGPGDPERQLAVASFTVEGHDPGRLAHELDRGGVCCRPGLHCAARAHRTLGTFENGGTIRFGLSSYNTFAEIDKAADLLMQLIRP